LTKRGTPARSVPSDQAGCLSSSTTTPGVIRNGTVKWLRISRSRLAASGTSTVTIRTWYPVRSARATMSSTSSSRLAT